MSYQVLARKWRPQNFSSVVGQQHILTALTNGLSMGRIHHAYLFSGTRGVGKTSIARLLAKGLNCETGITANPCGQCGNCREIEQGRFVDLIEIDAASRTKVEDTRELLDNVQYAPARGRFKIYLIDEVHMLSRHSFNALLKTLEEPPEHVKFLLATTDPQKLPVTILSRCLQFHLKALDIELIRGQLEKIVTAEGIDSEPRALLLLARAAEGSMRDALSLADQAIALGQGQLSTELVKQMLGLLDTEQPLALLEALTSGKGAAVMAQVERIASLGVDWQNLLLELQALLHRIAMQQLLPSASAEREELDSEQRLRELARTINPQDLQLYYQILLVGRKELAYAPDRRMGVEMTLLRALAFHPRLITSEATPPGDNDSGIQPDATTTDAMPISNTPTSNTSADITPLHSMPTEATAPALDNSQSAPAVESGTSVVAELPDSTAQLLQARNLLRRQRQESTTKKSEPAARTATQPVISALERLAEVSEQRQQRAAAAPTTSKTSGPAPTYRWKAKNPAQATAKKELTTPQALRTALEYEKTPELAARLAKEAAEHDPWALQIEQLEVPKLVQQLALNAFKTEPGEDQVCLHLRSSQRHLNTLAAQRALSEALSQLAGQPVNLMIVEDDDLATRTPLEWRQALYQEKLNQARQSIKADSHIQTLCRIFDAQLDEESIRPV